MKSVIKLTLLCVLATMAVAQDTAPANPPQGGPGMREHQGGRGRGAGMGMGRGLMAEITAVNADGFTVKTMQGNAATIKVSSETKFMRDRQEIKKTDFKVGDSVAVAGTPDTNDPTTWNASFVIDRTAQMKEFKENLGKTMIAGEVKAIDETKLTILRPDGQTQTIEVDENTSFHKGRESVTLADIKVGDHVGGRGALKNGVFVASDLRVGGAGGMGMGMGGFGREGRGAEGNQAQPK